MFKISKIKKIYTYLNKFRNKNMYKQNKLINKQVIMTKKHKLYIKI